MLSFLQPPGSSIPGVPTGLTKAQQLNSVYETQLLNTVNGKETKGLGGGPIGEAFSS